MMFRINIMIFIYVREFQSEMMTGIRPQARSLPLSSFSSYCTTSFSWKTVHGVSICMGTCEDSELIGIISRGPGGPP